LNFSEGQPKTRLRATPPGPGRLARSANLAPIQPQAGRALLCITSESPAPWLLCTASHSLSLVSRCTLAGLPSRCGPLWRRRISQSACAQGTPESPAAFGARSALAHKGTRAETPSRIELGAAAFGWRAGTLDHDGKLATRVTQISIPFEQLWSSGLGRA
jgi:hypothetical protein